MNIIVSHVLGSEGTMQGTCTSTAEEQTDKAEAEPDREQPEKQQVSILASSVWEHHWVQGTGNL